jgi:hypothetical protein
MHYVNSYYVCSVIMQFCSPETETQTCRTPCLPATPRAKSNAQAALLIRMVAKFPDMVGRLEAV